MKAEIAGRETHIATGSRPFQAPGKGVLLFVHGAGMDHTVWVMQARYFARHGYAVLAPDLPGHGRSAGEPLETVEAIADWLADLLGSLGVSSATVIGHSMGSLATYAFAARHPDLADQLVLRGGERLMERCAPGVFHADLAACNSFDPGDLGPVPAGTTIVMGTEDRMTPMKAGLKVAAALGDGATVRTLSGAGHSMMSECPNEALDILIEAIGVQI